MTSASNNNSTTNAITNIIGNRITYNNINKDKLTKLFGDSYVRKTPPVDIILPCGLPLLSWSTSITVLTNTYINQGLSVQDADRIALQAITLYAQDAISIRTILNSKGNICNIICSFKATSEIAKHNIQESVQHIDITKLDTMIDRSENRYYNFESRQYIDYNGKLLNGTIANTNTDIDTDLYL